MPGEAAQQLPGSLSSRRGARSNGLSERRRTSRLTPIFHQKQRDQMRRVYRYATIGRRVFVEGMSVRRHGYPYRRPGRCDGLAANRHYAGPCHRPDRSVAFDRSAALIHPAVDRTGRRRGGAGAGLGAERRGRAARRVTAGKEAHDWVFGMRDRRGTYFPKTIFRKLMYPLSRKAISTVPKLAHWTPFAFVIDSFLVRTPNYAIRHCD